MHARSETRALFFPCAVAESILLSCRCLLIWGLALNDAFSLPFGFLSILKLLSPLLLSLLLAINQK